MRNVYTVCGHVVEIDSALNKSDKEHRIKVNVLNALSRTRLKKLGAGERNDQLLRVRSQARAR
jgi:hypothetical protein